MTTVWKSIEFSNGQLTYLVVGNGKKSILAFHGFGQSAEEFVQYVTSLYDDYTIYVFDHFYHGKSHWETESPINVEAFSKVIEAFLVKENIDRFNIIGYSLGGKWAHSIVRFFPERVNKVFLCAPDGSKSTFYYSFSSRSALGRWVLKKTIQHSAFFFWLLKTLYKVSVLDKSIYRFVYYQMGTEQQRKQVYNTWTKYRYYKGLSKISIDIYNSHNIPLQILLGSYDRVIQPKWFDIYKSKIDSLQLVTVTKGHRSVLTSIAGRSKDFFDKE